MNRRGRVNGSTNRGHDHDMEYRMTRGTEIYRRPAREKPLLEREKELKWCISSGSLSRTPLYLKGDDEYGTG